MLSVTAAPAWRAVALRKESVDRNSVESGEMVKQFESLSARRAWIEMQVQKSA